MCNTKKIANVIRKLFKKYIKFRQVISHQVISSNQNPDLLYPLIQDCYRIIEFCADFLLQKLNLLEFVRALGKTYFACELSYIVPFLRIKKDSEVIIEIIKAQDRFHLNEARDQLVRIFKTKLPQPREAKKITSKKNRIHRHHNFPKYLKDYILF